MSLLTLDIKMVVNACRNKMLEFEGEIVEMKTFEKKSKQARNKVSQVQLLCDSIENLSDTQTQQFLVLIRIFVTDSNHKR